MSTRRIRKKRSYDWLDGISTDARDVGTTQVNISLFQPATNAVDNTVVRIVGNIHCAMDVGPFRTLNNTETHTVESTLYGGVQLVGRSANAPGLPRDPTFF